MSHHIHGTLVEEHGVSCCHSIIQHADHVGFRYEEVFPYGQEEHWFGFYIVHTESEDRY
ncbi:hypothetical protein ACVR1I_05430 [Streptococcus cameli]